MEERFQVAKGALECWSDGMNSHFSYSIIPLVRHPFCQERMRVRAITFFAALTLFVPATVQARDSIHEGDVVVVPLRGEVSLSLLTFLRRAEKAAENSGASAIIFE